MRRGCDALHVFIHQGLCAHEQVAKRKQLEARTAQEASFGAYCSS